MIGEPLIRRKVEKMVRQQYKKDEPIEGEVIVHSKTTEERKIMIRFLERQKLQIEKQIELLRGM